MIRELGIVVLLAMLTVGGGVSFASQARAEENLFGPGAAGDLKSQLNAGLKARRPEEFAFTNKVVQLVNAKTLPLPLVQSTFLWARRRQAYHPYVYFEKALRERAQAQGIVIPPQPTSLVEGFGG